MFGTLAWGSVAAMRFAEADSAELPLVTHYGPEGIEIAGRRRQGALLLTPDAPARDWEARHADDLSPEHLAPLIACAPQVIVIGTGARQVFLPPRLLAAAYAAGIGVEVMATAPACRTYNILLGEGRRVAAGLLPLSAPDASVSGS